MTVAEHFDDVALEYDYLAERFKDNSFFLEHLSVNRTRALDMGCGSGLLTHALADHYQQVIGIDIADHMLAIARSKRPRPNIQYQQMDANALQFDEKFDLIVSDAVLHHLDVAKTLNRLKQLLAPAGKLVIRDIASPRETPPTIVYIVGAVQEFVPNCFRFNLQTAIRIFRYRTSRHWLAHLASDHYLSDQRFREIYSQHLPDGVFLRPGTIIWENQSTSME